MRSTCDQPGVCGATAEVLDEQTAQDDPRCHAISLTPHF